MAAATLRAPGLRPRAAMVPASESHSFTFYLNVIDENFAECELLTVVNLAFLIWECFVQDMSLNQYGLSTS